MQKVIKKDFRPTKEFTLPMSGITLVCFPSILVSEVDEISKVQEGSDLEKALRVLSKAISNWNYYNNETDENPIAVTPDSFLSLPSTDVNWLVEQWTAWSDSLKKKELS